MIDHGLETLRREGPLALVRSAASYARWAIEVRVALLRLQARARRAERPAEVVDVVESFRSGRVTIPAWQLRRELEQLLETLAAEQPRTVLEIGTALGGTLFAFTRVAAPDALLVTVDLPAGAFGGGYHRARMRLYRGFARGGQEVKPLFGDSHERSTLERVEQALAGRPVDFLFVDGDHEYGGVRADFELYGPLVRPGGLIALHDIVPGDEQLVGGVPTFWRELKASHDDTVELVDSWEQEAYGIGLFRVREPLAPLTGAGRAGRRLPLQ